MARLYTSGFEFQIVTGTREFTGNGLNTGSGIDTTLKRSGAASLKIANSTSIFSWVSAQFKTADSATEAFVRVYVYFSAFPASGTTDVFAVASITGGSMCAKVYYDKASGTLKATNTAGTVIGTSTVVTTSTWYRLELDVSGGSGTAILKAYLDGVNFATTTTTTVSNFGILFLGTAFNAGIITANYDDVAINDTSGAAQTGLPGAGSVIRLKPDSAGDVNTFSTLSGGTAGVANNYTRVNEIVMDDATTFNGSSTLNEHDLFNLEASGVGNADTVKVVEVWGRFRSSVADTTAAIKFEVEKAGSGTILQSAAIIPNSTSWKTNTTGSLFTAPLVTYTDPDGAAWTGTTLGTIQAGYKLTAAPAIAGRRIDVSILSVIIDYVPSVGLSISVGDTATTSETKNVAAVPLVNTGDTATTSESPDVLRAQARDISQADTTTTSENVVVAAPPIVNQGDTATTSETVVIFEPEINPSFGDTVTTSETVATPIVTEVNQGDSTSTSETVSVVITTLFVSLNDTATTSETVSLFIPYVAVVVGDTSTTSETVTTDGTGGISVGDTTSTSETINVILAQYLLSTGDTATTSENVNVSEEEYFVSVGDTATTSESKTLNMPVNIVLSDTLTTSETATVLIPTYLIIAGDASTLSESVNVFEPAYMVSVNDTTTTSESKTLVLAIPSINGDTTTTTESVLLTITKLFINVGDTAITSEFLSLGATPISKGDTATIREHIIVSVILNANNDSPDVATPVDGSTATGSVGTDSDENITDVSGATYSGNDDSLELINNRSGDTATGGGDSLDTM